MQYHQIPENQPLRLSNAPNQPKSAFEGHNLNLFKYKDAKNSLRNSYAKTGVTTPAFECNTIVTRNSIYQRLFTDRKNSLGGNERSQYSPYAKQRSELEYRPIKITEEAFLKAKEVQELKQMSNDINNYTHDFKNSWIYLLMMVAQLFKILLRMLTELVLFLVRILVLVYDLAFKLMVVCLLTLYFFITMWLPTKRRSPFHILLSYEKMRRKDLAFRHERVLFLDLDNTLVFTTRYKPQGGKFFKVKVKAAGEEGFEKFYLIKRPYLDEFLIQVI